MSDLSAVFLMLAIFLGAGLCLEPMWKRAHQRCDEIATGVANGRPLPPKYRSLLLCYDYLGHGFAPTFILLPLAVGFLVVSRHVGDPDARTLAHLCAVLSGTAGIGNAILCVAWIVHLRSVLRRAEATQASGV
jgi:hypothetical protein